jgi:hypothetical protein
MIRRPSMDPSPGRPEPLAPCGSATGTPRAAGPTRIRHRDAPSSRPCVDPPPGRPELPAPRGSADAGGRRDGSWVCSRAPVAAHRPCADRWRRSQAGCGRATARTKAAGRRGWRDERRDGETAGPTPAERRGRRRVRHGRNGGATAAERRGRRRCKGARHAETAGWWRRLRDGKRR